MKTRLAFLLGGAFLLGASVATLFFLASGPTFRTKNELPTGTFGSGPNMVQVKQESSPLLTHTFHWSSVESADYKIYIANLRKIGCPEKTIRDIVVADVNAMYADKERPLRDLLSRKPYWNNKPTGNTDANVEVRQKLRQFIAEKHQLLTVLLGEGVVQDLGLASEYEEILASTDGPLGFLPVEKQSKVVELKREFDALVGGAFPAGPTNAALTQSYLTTKDNFYNQLKSVLSEGEFRIYKLQTSPEAAWIRFKYSDLNLTEEEFLLLYDFLAPYESQTDPYLGKNLEAAQTTLVIRNALDEKVREIVGEERYKKSIELENYLWRKRDGAKKN